MAVQTQIQVRRGTASSWTSTNPTLAAGELGFETDTGKFKIGTGAATWTSLTYAGGGQNTLTTYQYTATSGQTTFSGVDSNGNTLSYTVGNIQVYLNGVLLVNTAEYTATSGTSIVLGTGAVTGDSLTVTSLGAFTVSSDIPKSTLTAKGSIVTATAGSTPANLSVGANGTVLTADSAETSGLKWAAASSGALVLVKRSTFSNVANTGTTFDNVFTSTYKAYKVIIEELYAGTAANDGILEMLYSGTVMNEYYGASGGAQQSSATFVNIQNAGSAQFTFVDSIGVSTSPTLANFLFTGVGGSSREAQMTGTAHESASAIARFCGFNVGSNAYTGFRLRSSSTNVTGTVAVYGLATA
jgi:hypothetical protein